MAAILSVKITICIGRILANNLVNNIVKWLVLQRISLRYSVCDYKEEIWLQF